MLQRLDERNANLRYWVNGVLRHRDELGISPFDSVVQGGDAAWEGLRLYAGRIYGLDAHLDRLLRSALALGFTAVPSPAEITEAITEALRANGMTDGVHIRLTVTRGVKVTSGMDPRLNQSGCTLIVLPEHKPSVYDTAGVRLVTASVRRPGPDVLDPKIHHNKPDQLDSGEDGGECRRRGRRAHARRSRVRRGDQRHQPLRPDRRPAVHATVGRLSGGDHPGDRADFCRA
jgi:branched-chain amino acid aminotransferase